MFVAYCFVGKIISLHKTMKGFSNLISFFFLCKFVTVQTAVYLNNRDITLN